ncbi:3165_t:CDS:2 [Funneliformis mosseae]|uniref:3165_t:CDS:1 n=1 Tax=Funneliformis mosseae TaxID=27381 RepID=A0A9N8V568_FUNMO|nr:3165_t:CDS:2 [Funneliformis mosseae]
MLILYRQIASYQDDPIYLAMTAVIDGFISKIRTCEKIPNYIM